MAWMTTKQRQELFLGYFQSDPVVLLEEYARRFPKHSLYVRGIIKGTHYALETVGLARDLSLKASDVELIVKLNNGHLTMEELTALLPSLERANLVLRWRIAIAQSRLFDAKG